MFTLIILNKHLQQIFYFAFVFNVICKLLCLNIYDFIQQKRNKKTGKYLSLRKSIIF